MLGNFLISHGLPLEMLGLQHALERGAVHACHAGGLLHVMEGWTHHEMGPIPVHRIEPVWTAAMERGFLPVDPEGGFLDYQLCESVS